MSTFDSLPENEQNKYYDKATELLVDLLWCSRSWEAWLVGTMTQNDFIKADEDDGIVEDTARMLYHFTKDEKECLSKENQTLHQALQTLATPLEYKAVMLEIESLRQTNKED